MILHGRSDTVVTNATLMSLKRYAYDLVSSLVFVFVCTCVRVWGHVSQFITVGFIRPRSWLSCISQSCHVGDGVYVAQMFHAPPYKFGRGTFTYKSRHFEWDGGGQLITLTLVRTLCHNLQHTYMSCDLHGTYHSQNYKYNIPLLLIMHTIVSIKIHNTLSPSTNYKYMDCEPSRTYVPDPYVRDITVAYSSS